MIRPLRVLGISLFILGGIVLSFLLGASLWVVSDTSQFTQALPFVGDEEERAVPVYSHGLQTKEFFDLAYEKAGEQVEVEIYSMMSAHHLLVADKMAALFERVDEDEVKTVVIISPNHFSVGKSPAQISQASWETPYGTVKTDYRAVDRLLEKVEFLQAEEKAFETEHGIGALTPFVARSLPKAKIVPIAVHESLTREESLRFGQKIAEELPDALVVASVDISHNLPQYMADFHDDVTLRYLEAGGECAAEDCVLEPEVDSVATLRIATEINRQRGEQVWNLTHHRSSFKMVPSDNWEENTSHILGYFTEGSPVREMDFVSLHVAGDIMLDRGVRVLLDKNGIEYPWEYMSRYLDGVHLTVANLEGTVGPEPAVHTPSEPPYDFVFEPEAAKLVGDYFDVVSLANNHAVDFGQSSQIKTREYLDEFGLPWFGAWGEPTPRYETTVNGKKIALIGYHEFRPNQQLLVQQIEEAKADGNFVIVYPHWGTEYRETPDANQQALARLMADAGADLIIGGHPHVPQGVSEVNGVPVVWSLGNFIFDQRIPETWLAQTVGVIIEDDSVTLYLLPVYTKDGQPRPVSDTEAKRLLRHLANNSDATFKDQILTGSITFPL